MSPTGSPVIKGGKFSDKEVRDIQRLKDYGFSHMKGKELDAQYRSQVYQSGSLVNGDQITSSEGKP